MFERYQERQREMARRRLVVELRRHHYSLARHLAGQLGVLLVMLETRLHQLELSGEQTVGDLGNVQEANTGRAFTTSSL
jgi:hypothetical protein